MAFLVLLALNSSSITLLDKLTSPIYWRISNLLQICLNFAQNLLNSSIHSFNYIDKILSWLVGVSLYLTAFSWWLSYQYWLFLKIFLMGAMHLPIYRRPWLNFFCFSILNACLYWKYSNKIFHIWIWCKKFTT